MQSPFDIWLTRPGREIAILLSTVALLIAGALTVPGPAQATQTQQTGTARQLLQRAVHLEDAVGDPEAAIAAYEAVIAAADADASLSAVAEFRLAMLLAAIGRPEEAREHHRNITELYADDAALSTLVDLSRSALGDDVPVRSAGGVVARQLWEGTNAYASGALSPDGSFIAYVDWASGNLAIHDLDRGSEQFLIDLSPVLQNDVLSSNTVSPEGDQIAYTWYSADRGYEVRLIGRDGSRRRTLVRDWARPRHIELESWSRDGRQILAVAYIDESTHELVLIDARSGERRTVARLGATSPEVARLSPDGRWIAYHELNAGGTHDVMLTASDGSVTRSLVDHPANDLLPIWTTNGGSVLFVSDRTGTLAAWIVDVSPSGEAAGEPRLVRPDFGRSVPMGFTRDGALIYVQQVSLNDIYSATLDWERSTLGRRLPVGGRVLGVNRSPAISPNGERMAYLTEAGSLPVGLGPQVLSVRDFEGGTEQKVATKLRRTMPPRWHPDGRTLIAEGVASDDRWGVYRIDTETGETQRLVGWPEATCGCTAAPAISPDGEKLAYFRPRDSEGNGDLIVRDLTTGGDVALFRQATARDVLDIEFSPDGTRLAAALRTRDSPAEASVWRLTLLDVATGARTDVTSMGTNAEALTLAGWSADGDGIVFVRAEDDLHSLGWASADGRDVAWLIVDLPRDIRETRLHPRSDQLIFTAGEYRAQIWMLENPLVALERDR
jgi:Tol biopolymer transport system component